MSKNTPKHCISVETIAWEKLKAKAERADLTIGKLIEMFALSDFEVVQQIQCGNK